MSHCLFLTSPPPPFLSSLLTSSCVKSLPSVCVCVFVISSGESHLVFFSFSTVSDSIYTSTKTQAAAKADLTIFMTDEERAKKTTGSVKMTSAAQDSAFNSSDTDSNSSVDWEQRLSLLTQRHKQKQKFAKT